MSNHVNLLGVKSLVNINSNKDLFDTFKILDEEDGVIRNDDLKGVDIVDNFISSVKLDSNFTDDIKGNSTSNSEIKTSQGFENYNKNSKSILSNHLSSNENSLKPQSSYNNFNSYSNAYPEKEVNNASDNVINVDNSDVVNNYINSVKTSISDINGEIDEEIGDEKMLLIDKIDEIRIILNKKKINLDNVPLVNYSSTLQEIKYTYRLLQIKNNRDLTINLTNTVIKVGVNFLEKVFDGNKTYFGVSPNLTGYNKVVQLQLKDLNIESEQISSDFFNRQSASPALKMALALIPGMIYYSTSRGPSITNSSDSQISDQAQKKINLDDAISDIENL